MKTIKIFICTLAFILLTFACKKEVLDTTSTRQLASTYYEYDDHLDNAVNGAYAPLQLETVNWGTNPWLWGSCATSDDVWAGGGNSTDRVGYQTSNTHAISPSEPDLLNLWQNYFRGIDRCNLILGYVKPDDAAKKNAIGQAQFLSGYYYFYLTRMFGGLPLMSSVPTPTEQKPRATIDATYTFIEDLLTKAVNGGMQERTGGADPANGLATKASAQALLGKVYMYHASFVDETGNLNTSNKKYYTSAIQYLSAVANNPNYMLDPKGFWHVFSPGNVHGPESVFEVNFTSVVTNGAQGNPLATLCGPRTAGLVPINDTINYGWGFNQPTKALVDFFKTQNDPVRLDATVFDTITLQKWHGASVLFWQNPKDGNWDRKHYSNPHLFTAWNGNANPMIVLRLADIYLLLAEAYFQTGDNANALIYVNKVRERVHLAKLTSVTMADIKNERHLELALEGDRYFDLVRWGDAGNVLLGNPSVGIFSYNDGVPGKSSNGLWPIPNSEITRTNGFGQNPGYK
jgi:hypothetical protein